MSKTTRTIRQRSLWSEAMGRFIRNPLGVLGLSIIVIMVVACLLAPVLYPGGYDVQDTSQMFLFPSAAHPCGTDNLGRDVLCRLLYGGRTSLLIGAAATAFATVFGTLLGALAGFYGGRVDAVIMRCMDILSSIPSVLLAIAISSALGGGLQNAILAISISFVPPFARMMRGPVLSVKEQQYIEAARATDANDLRIIWKYILPNVSSQLIVEITMHMAVGILTSSSLAFIGLGVTPPTPEWGSMISAGRNYILKQAYLVTFPGICIALTVLSFNLVGDALRDALDPRLKR
ncbi:ABC transporter permease [Feifania hominis]|uniref:ABC transporter permease n=1 Tax=Feifania hominis TaxID=2763660 RepID=A0A926DEM5_9FIRM|nr:ABC transporter permease [Feifania hominis]MBC8536426.1 ABC transporter permease [Feifania hominis]